MTGANNFAGAKPTWVSETISGTLPAARAHHSGVYDPTTNSLIVFGGYDCASTYFGDVWVLSNANAVSGTLAWTQLSPTGPGPSPRQSSSAVYNSTTNTLTVFGGDAGGVPFGDIWILSNANGTGGTPAWSEITANSGPVARSGHTAIYDSVNNRMTVYGGWNGSSLVADAWVLSIANGQGNTSTRLCFSPEVKLKISQHTGDPVGWKTKLTFLGELRAWLLSFRTITLSR